MEPEFKDLVKGKWNNYEVQGNSMSRLKDKLKLLKKDIKEWNKSVFGNIEECKREIMMEIENLDVKDAECDLLEGEKLRRWELLSQKKSLDKKMESLNRKKARSTWYKHGDSNSKYYHSIIRWRKLRNEVKGVEIDNQWCEEPEAVCREVKHVFEQRFKATPDHGVRLGLVDFMTLPEVISLKMVEDFSEEEVRAAVWMCEGSKSPGPDGYNFNFIKSNWETLKEDILEAVYMFQESGSFSKGCNASFIALIPKMKNPVLIEHFRSISLVGALYKIITKVLSCRIKEVMHLVIDDVQSAFLEDRGMLDSDVMANEVIEEVRRNRKSGVCLKVDFEKAYDSVRWTFLLDMLQRMGFHSKWIKWVKGCLETATVLVLVNGSPTEEFRPTRGLRQEDPLAPFLFLIVAEGLAGLVRKAVKEDLLRGIKVGRDEVDCCLLQFADDTVFLCEDSFSNVFTIKAILRVFEMASGLKVNFYKSKIAGLKVDRSNLELYTKTLNCDIMQIPFVYLGMQIGGNPRRIQFWDLVVEKVKARLSAWKGKCLSFAGRLCLIKSVLTFIPLFYLSFYKAPTTVCDKISSIQRRFLWAWGKDSKYIAWVRWENVCKSKEEGGLGVKDIKKFNRALLAKWKWRMMSEEEGKWKEILVSKYYNGSVNIQRCGKNYSWWWSDLGKVCEEGEGEGWFRNHVPWKVGNGDKIRFWEDTWLGNNKLKFMFPRLYTISLEQGKLVGEVGTWGELGWSWRLGWRRTRFEWETSVEEEMMNLRDAEDIIEWSGDPKGVFSV